MGSGIVFVVIIGLWAVILVPMWLRSHDAATETKSVDRFSTAMRTLSRRSTGPAASRDLVMPGRTRTVELSGGRAPSSTSRREQIAAQTRMRRRRSGLFVLGGLLAVLLVAAAVGAVPLLLPLLALVGTGAYAVVLRRQVVAQARLDRIRRRRAAPQAAAVASPSRPARASTFVTPQAPTWPVAREVRVEAGIAAAAPAAVAETDRGWAPTPVVLPTYVTAPPATSVPRVIDLTHPGAWSAAHMLEHAAGVNAPDPDEIFDGRAVPEAPAATGTDAMSPYDAVVAEQQAVAATVAGSTARPFLEEDAVFDQEDEAFLSLLDRRAVND